MTGQNLIDSAFRLIGVLASGESPSSAESNNALTSLNDMLDTWSNEQLLIPSKVYETLALVVNQQSYQMGTGAPDFNTARPQKIEDLNWQQVSGTTTVELPIQIISQDEWATLSVKTITSNLPTKMWPQFTYPYAKLWFWPTPSVSGNIVMWSWKPLTQITTLATAISLPPGYNKALRYSLAVELAPEYGKQIDPLIVEQAIGSKAMIKRMNTSENLMGVDTGVLPKRSSWNWFTGE